MAGYEIPAQRGEWEDEVRTTLLDPAQARVLGIALTMRIARLAADGEAPEAGEREFAARVLCADRLGSSFSVEWRPKDGYAGTIRDELEQFRHTLAAAQTVSIMYDHRYNRRIERDMKIAKDMMPVFDEIAQIHTLANELEDLDL